MQEQEFDDENGAGDSANCWRDDEPRGAGGPTSRAALRLQVSARWSIFSAPGEAGEGSVRNQGAQAGF